MNYKNIKILTNTLKTIMATVPKANLSDVIVDKFSISELNEVELREAIAYFSNLNNGDDYADKTKRRNFRRAARNNKYYTSD